LINHEIASSRRSSQGQEGQKFKGLTLWVDGTDSFSLEPGMVVQVPKGVKHRTPNVTEDLTIYDVFCQALF